MKLHYLLYAMLLCLLGVFCCVLTFAFWLFWPYYKTIEIENFSLDKPVHIETPVVHPGDVLRYNLSYCKYIDATPHVYRTLVDGQKIPLTNDSGNLPIGCYSTPVTTTVIPETVNPGRYYLDVVIEYKVNPIRSIRTHYFTEYFQVVDENIPSTSKPPRNSGKDTDIPDGGDIVKP